MLYLTCLNMPKIISSSEKLFGQWMLFMVSSILFICPEGLYVCAVEQVVNNVCFLFANGAYLFFGSIPFYIIAMTCMLFVVYALCTILYCKLLILVSHTVSLAQLLKVQYPPVPSILYNDKIWNKNMTLTIIQWQNAHCS